MTTLLSPNYLKSFSQDAINLVIAAYNTGLLQYHPMQVLGVTVSMRITSIANEFTMSSVNGLATVRCYPSDLDHTTEHAIAECFTSVL